MLHPKPAVLAPHHFIALGECIGDIPDASPDQIHLVQEEAVHVGCNVGVFMQCSGVDVLFGCLFLA